MGDGEADDPDVSYGLDGATATILLRRPTLTTAVKEGLLEAVRHASQSPNVRAIVLTGTGRAFCTGQDLDEHAQVLQADPGSAFDTVSRHYNPIVTALTGAPKPVITAINGTCAGAGLSLALACDLRIAAAGVRFATAFTAIGLSFDSGLSATLSRAVGATRASELILLGEPFTAEQALDWGLVSRVVTAEELPGTARAMAAKLAAGPTQAYATAKRAILDSWTAPLAKVLQAERASQVRLGATQDHERAVRAFLDKQPPTFTGRD